MLGARVLRWLVAGLAVAASAALGQGREADGVELRLRTLPRDVAIQVVEGNVEVAGQTIWLPRQKTARPIKLRVSRAGYHPQEIAVDLRGLPPGTQRVAWPASAPLELEPIIVTVRFVTAPAGARIYLQAEGSSPGRFVGLAGQAVPVNLAQGLGARGSSLVLRFEKPGYLPEVVRIEQPQESWPNGAENRWPAEGTFALTPLEDPRTGWIGLSGLLAVMLGILWLGRSWRRARAASRRRQLLEQLRGSFPGQHPLFLTRLDRYRLLEVLGAGGMGVVYRAVPDASLDEDEAVAVKLMHRDLCAREGYRERFRSEICLWSQLSHPNLVQVLDFGEQEGRLFLVMELLEGETLKNCLAARGRLTPPDVCRAADSIASAVDYAHRRGILHRDLKPSNLFVLSDGRIKVSDLGIAARIGEEASKTVVGTPPYMAPEQARGQAGPPADQYALGVVLYELLVGEPPLTALPSDLPAEVRIALDRMRAPAPEDRYPTLRLAAEALTRAFASSKEESTRPAG